MQLVVRVPQLPLVACSSVVLAFPWGCAGGSLSGSPLQRSCQTFKTSQRELLTSKRAPPCNGGTAETICLPTLPVMLTQKSPTNQSNIAKPRINEIGGTPERNPRRQCVVAKCCMHSRKGTFLSCPIAKAFVSPKSRQDVILKKVLERL